METEKSLRYRINISRGMKGGVSFEGTVEGVGYTQEEILAKSDLLVRILERKYPPELPGNNKGEET